MSLINKVLRDLEAQREATEDIRAQQSPLADAGLRPVRPVYSRLSRTQLVRIGLLLALSAAAVFAWFQWGGAFFGAKKPAPVASAPLPQRTAVVPPPQESKPQPTDVPTAVPKDAKPATPPAPVAKSPEPPATKPPVTPPKPTEPLSTTSAPSKKTTPVAAPTQDVVVRKSPSETTQADLETVKAVEPAITAKAEPPVARKPEVVPAETAEKPGKDDEVAEEAPAPKAPAGKIVLEKKLKPLTPDERAESEYRLAASALQQKRTGEAESRLRTALAAQPSHLKARELLAGLALQGGRWREAQSLLEQGVALHPNHYPFAQLLARSYVDHGQEQKALALLEKSRAAAGGDPEYLAFLATLYQRAGRQDDAARNFNEALRQRPQEGRWWLGLAISLEAVEKWKESTEAYQRAVTSGSLDKQLLQYSQQRLAVVKNK